MSRLPRFLVLLATLLVVAPPAHAQLRGLLNRARDAVRAPAADAAAAVQGAASATLGSSTSTLDYSRFLGMRYWPLRGEFAFGEPKDHLLFPPDGIDGYAGDFGEYQIRDAGGRVVARQALGTLQTTGSAAFMTIGISGSPRSDGPLASGAYTLDLVFQGRVASRIPFTVAVSDNGDPFDPQTLYRRDGPWRSLAYFEHETDRRDYRLTFHAWVHAADLGAESARVRFVLTRDGATVATCKTVQCPQVNTEGDWGVVEEHLVTYASRDEINATAFTIDDMTPGAYVMTVQTFEGDRVLQTYPFTGGAGTIVAHARSAVDYEPRHDFLTPRRMSGQTLQQSNNLYWVEAGR